MMKLPLGGLRWLNEGELEDFDINQIDLDGEDGYILECDLHYPTDLHAKHQHLPLAPEFLEIDEDHLSKYSKEALFDCDNTTKYKSTKLLTHFHDRKNYVVHGKNLKLYLDLGLKLKKIRKGLTFKQEAFIAPYIEKCTAARKKASSKFIMDQFKKLANVIYGKTIENIRDYMKVSLHTVKNNAAQAVSSPNFKSFSIIHKDLVQTNHSQMEIVHNKPIVIGFTILELSKWIMYDFFYNKMLKNAKFEIDLGMTDTDSLLFKTTKPKEFWNHVDKFMDYSNYPETHPKFTTKNKAKLGCFKDELCGKSKCLGFVGLRSKCYSMLLQPHDKSQLQEKKVCKGLGRVAINNRLKYKQYIDCLTKKKPIRHHYASIKSVKHNLSTVLYKKKALSHFDCKRWLFNCGVHSAPYGSCLIKMYKNRCPYC